MADFSDTIYQEYRTHLFKYHKAMEIIKTHEVTKKEIEKLKTYNLTLKNHLKNITMDKKAADLVAKQEIRILREELKKMMKKTKNMKSFISESDSDSSNDPPSNLVKTETLTPKAEPLDDSQKAKPRKRKIKETISQSEMTSSVQYMQQKKKAQRRFHQKNAFKKEHQLYR